jgi:lauroyl/myristoyl acyltransferase/pimeloyl-ACP methyl ester carboxylesterase
MRRLLGRFYITGVFWYRLHGWGVQLLPRWAMAPLVLLFTSFFFLCLRRIRKAIAHNLEAVLGPCGWWSRQVRIYRTMWNLAWCLSERYERLSGRREPVLSLVGETTWKRKASGREGFVIVTAHIGSWETALFNPGEGSSRSIHVVREEEADPRAQSFIRELVQSRKDERIKVHFVRADDARLAGELLVGLRRGDVVATQGDRPRSGGRTVRTHVFGRPLDLPLGPAVLARAAGVEIVPIFCFRRGRLDTEVVVREPIRVGLSHDRSSDLRQAVESIAREIEWAIRRHPFQWFCFRDLWGGPPSASNEDHDPGRSPLPGTRAGLGLLAAVSLLASVLALSCTTLRVPEIPLQTREYAPAGVGLGEAVVVLLPGRRSGPEAFERHGLVEVVRRARPEARVVAVDAHLGYYRKGVILERLWVDVLAAAHARGSEIWLVGTSLGGAGALALATLHPDVVDGAVLLAPYLGSSDLITAIESAGGPRAWKAEDAGDALSAMWVRTRDLAESEEGPRLFLGFGRQDRMARDSRLLAELLPADRVLLSAGGHRWAVWRGLLGGLVERGALTGVRSPLPPG